MIHDLTNVRYISIIVESFQTVTDEHCLFFISGDTYMRIVIKIGTSTLAHSTGLVNLRRVEQLVHVVADLKNAGHEIVLVSSGGLVFLQSLSGAGKLGLKKRPDDIPGKQACASVGQCELMYIYDKLFSQYNHTVSQVLLTHDVVDVPERKQNVINTFERLLQMNVLPIVNENDAVSTEEIAFGDNDTLSAIVGQLVKADLLVILSDIDGLYDMPPQGHPQAKLIPFVGEITNEIIAAAGGSGSSLGTGGMATKIQAAQIAMDSGFAMSLIHGGNPDLLYDVVEGKPAGTRFEKKLVNK